MPNNSAFSLGNPQYYLEKYCHYEYRDSESYYNVDEMLWSSFTVLTSSLVVPCIRDQSSYFVNGLNDVASVDSISNFFGHYLPYYTIICQIIAAIIAIVGYYRTYKPDAGFACFGLFTLAMPFSIGILLPLTSFFVKTHKGKVPHRSYATLIQHTIFPYVAVAIGLPGIHHLLNNIIPCVKGLWSACSCCCCCCTIPCKIPADWKSDLELYASKLYSIIPIVWFVLSVFIVIVPLIVFVGNTLLVIVNAAALTACIAVTTYISYSVVPMLGSSWREILQRGVVNAVKELLLVKPHEFDLTQVSYRAEAAACTVCDMR